MQRRQQFAIPSLEWALFWQEKFSVYPFGSVCDKCISFSLLRVAYQNDNFICIVETFSHSCLVRYQYQIFDIYQIFLPNVRSSTLLAHFLPSNVSFVMSMNAVKWAITPPATVSLYQSIYQGAQRSAHEERQRQTRRLLPILLAVTVASRSENGMLVIDFLTNGNKMLMPPISNERPNR